MLFGMSKLIDSENENEFDRNPEIILIKEKRMEEDNEEKISPMMKLIYDDDSDYQSHNDESISENVEEYLFKPSKLLYDDSNELIDKKERSIAMKNKDNIMIESQFKVIKEKNNGKFDNNESIKEKEILRNQSIETNNKELNIFKNNIANNNSSKDNEKEYLVKQKMIILDKKPQTYKEDKNLNIIENKGKNDEIKKSNIEKEEKVKEDESKNKENEIKVRYGRYKRHYYKMLNEKKKDAEINLGEMQDKEKVKEQKVIKEEKEEKYNNILGTEPNYQRKFIRNYKFNLELKNEKENKKENENILATIKPIYNRRRFLRSQIINENQENEKSNKNEVRYGRKFYSSNQKEKDKKRNEKEKENISNKSNNEGIIYRFRNYQLNSKDKEKEKNEKEVGLIKPSKYYYEKERNIRVEETLKIETKTKTWKHSKLNRSIEENDTKEDPNLYSKRRRYKNISDLTEKNTKNEIKELQEINGIPIKKRIYERKERKDEDDPNHFFQRTFYGRLNRRNDLSNEIKIEEHKIKENNNYAKYNIRSNKDTLSSVSSPYKYKSSYKRRNEKPDYNINNYGNNYKQDFELNHSNKNQIIKTDEGAKTLCQNRTEKNLFNNNNYFRDKIIGTKNNDKRETKNGIIYDNKTSNKLPNNYSFARKTYFYSNNNK